MGVCVYLCECVFYNLHERISIVNTRFCVLFCAFLFRIQFAAVSLYFWVFRLLCARAFLCLPPSMSKMSYKTYTPATYIYWIYSKYSFPYVILISTKNLLREKIGGWHKSQIARKLPVRNIIWGNRNSLIVFAPLLELPFMTSTRS